MVSLTTHTTRRRKIRARTAGKAKSKIRSRTNSPAFPIHPEGYPATAPDAKKA